MNALAASGDIPKEDNTAGVAISPALVFLHAASYTRKMWLPQLARLQGEFRTMALDLPGHGELAQMPFSFASSARVIQEAMDRAAIDRAVLVGASLGGCVAMDFASEYSGRVAGLALSGCTFDPRTLLCRLVLTGESLVFPRGAKLFARSLARSLRRRYPAAIAEEIIASGAYWNSAADAVKAMRGVDLRAKLAAFYGPTLIINGERDWVHRTAERSFAAAARDATVEPVARAGHIASLDEPEAFAAAVREFVNTIADRDIKRGANIQ